jgi:hypothetical protein
MAPEPEYLTQVALVFDLNEEGQNFHNELAGEKKVQFRLFALGSKHPGKLAWDKCELMAI